VPDRGTAVDELTLRELRPTDPEPMAEVFEAIDWDKPAELYRQYLKEQADGTRDVLVAELGGRFAGYVTVYWATQDGVPEIMDLSVLPAFWRRRIGTALMDAAEKRVSERSSVVGIGVGMHAGYGPAQRMYVRRGYIPDGEGLSYDGKPVKSGATVVADDSLTMHFTKRLR